jgi:hypothetical protein
VQSIAFTDTAGVKNEIVFYLWGSTYYYNIANSTETVIDTPPSASSVSISGSLVAGNQITGNYTYNDVDGDPESGTTFQWYRADNQSGTSKAAISGATSQNYTLNAANVGKYIQFGVTPANANSTGAEALSAWSTVVEASNTTALIGSVYANTNKYVGITSAANGKLYCAPYNATQVLEINSVGTFNSFSEFFAFDEFGAPSTIYMNTL